MRLHFKDPISILIALLTVAIATGCGRQEAPSNPPSIGLQEAVVQGDLEAAHQHIAAGSDLNEPEAFSGSTPLISAATFGRVEIAKALIEAGADLNIKNSEGSTALLSAAFLCHPEIVKVLLERGADASLRNNAGATALVSVEGPWEMVKPIYDLVGGLLAPVGLELDYERIKATRPKIAEMLRSSSDRDEAMVAVDPEFAVKTITPTGDERYLNVDSDYIFDQEKLPTFELRLPGSALAQIDAAPAAEEYVEGSLTFEGETISPVGIRYKGSIGAFIGCLSNPNWLEPSGHKICTKLSMKIKFNWKGSDRKFYGLNKLQLHSQNLDASQMRERLGYWLFREMGVPAPRSVHARLVINGRFSGLYALTEQIDGRFTRYHFDDGEGNLYKEIWPLNSDGQPYDEQSFLNHLKTNEDQNPTADLIHAFGQDLANSDDTDLQAVITKWMDVEEILSYAVVDRMIRHDDGPFHWYCDGGECRNHNYYWYEDPIESRLHLIPWDLDSAFENINSYGNPVTSIADDWGQVSAGCDPFSYGMFGIPQRSAACDRLTRGWASFEDEYERLKTRFIEGPFSQVDGQLDVWADQIREATAEASRMHDDAISLTRWENAVESLRARLSSARSH